MSVRPVISFLLTGYLLISFGYAIKSLPTPTEAVYLIANALLAAGAAVLSIAYFVYLTKKRPAHKNLRPLAEKASLV